MNLLLLLACKKPPYEPVEIERLCEVTCGSELRSQPERDLCASEVIACQAACNELLQGQGLFCVECLEDNGVFGPYVDEVDGEPVCDPGVVTRGGCTGICPP